MRIEFLSDDNPLYILPFFEEFLRNHASEFEIVQVSCCRPMGKRSRVQLLRALASLYGLLGIVVVLSRLVLARLLDVLPRSRKAKRFYTISQLCRAYSIPFASDINPNAPGWVEQTRKRAPDLIVSVACPYILKELLLKVPPLGCINMHHASLPKYKGMMPTFWQMYNGETQVGMTIHTMTPRIDEGKVLFQEKFAIEPGETLDHLIRRSKQHGAHCLAKVLRDIASGSQTVIAVDGGEGSYFTFPTVAQIREFRRRGLRAI
jgi:methionyl-tRNA formyltransferase